VDSRAAICAVSSLALLFAIGAGTARSSWAGTSSTQELDPGFIDVSRQVHRFRHWTWSGIFPFYGGWIPDPHFLATPIFPVPRDVAQILGDPAARYQGVDINPWFEDDTSEIVLAIESGGVVHEYSIANEFEPPLKYGFINNGGGIYVFPYESSLAFYTSLDIDRRAFLFVTLPFKRFGDLVVALEATPEYERAIAHLGATGRYRSLKEDPCRGLADLYERFERCPD
jgi:hypothetical protein